jgi:hypothetical protein
MRNLYIILLAIILLSQLSCGRSDLCQPSGRYLVIKTYAGMANRLRILASARIMAALTDRHLVVHWPINPREMAGTWSDFFLNPLTLFENSPLALKDHCTLKDISQAYVGDSYIKNLGNLNDAGEGNDRVRKITKDTEPVVYFETSLNFSPDSNDMSSSDYKKRYRDFYENLDPVLRITQAVTKFQKDNDFENKYLIGIHYRSWNSGPADDVDINRDLEHRYVEDFLKKMKDAVNQPLSDTDNKPVAFFLATDSATIKEKMLASPELAGRIYTAPYEIERDTITGQQNALIDFFLLGKTNYIIGTYQSSFSDEAAHLTVQNRKVDVGAAVYK